jgi:hypothetical protein
MSVCLYIYICNQYPALFDYNLPTFSLLTANVNLTRTAACSGGSLSRAAAPAPAGPPPDAALLSAADAPAAGDPAAARRAPEPSGSDLDPPTGAGPAGPAAAGGPRPVAVVDSDGRLRLVDLARLPGVSELV